MYTLLFEEFADTYSRQEVSIDIFLYLKIRFIFSKRLSCGFVQVLGALVTHVGSAVSFEVTSALQIMASLASKHARELIPLSYHINGS